MGNPVVHFEIGGPDGPALQKFYQDLFGWKVQVQGEEMGNYGLVQLHCGRHRRRQSWKPPRTCPCAAT